MKNNSFTLLLFIFFSVYTLLFPAGKDNIFDKMALDSWSLKEGFPSNAALSIATDHQNYIWVGTKSGLVRFDGRNFKIFNKKTTPALKGECIQTLLFDSAKNLWIGSSNGLVVYREGIFKYISGTENLHISSIIRDQRGNIWFGTYNNFLFKIIEKNGKISVLQYKNRKGILDYRILSLLSTQRGDIFIGTKHKGLLVYSEKEDIFKSVELKGLDKIYRIYTMIETMDQKMYIGLYKKGIYITDFKNGYELLDQTAGLSSNNIITLFQDRKKSIWVGTSKGINCLYKNRNELSIDKAFENKIVIKFIQDKFNRIWFGTKTKGLNCLKKVPYRIFNRNTGLANVILDLYRDRSNRIWVSTYDKGVFYSEDQKFIRFIPENREFAELLKSLTLLSIAQDQSGTFFLGTDGFGLIKTDLKEFELFRKEDGLLDNNISSLYVDSQNSLWIGSYTGIMRYDKGSFSTIILWKKKDKGYKRPIFFEYGDKIFIGTHNGLYEYLISSARLTHSVSNYSITSMDGLLNKHEPDQLLIGTQSNGLFLLEKTKLKKIAFDSIINSKYIRNLKSSGCKNLWISSLKGIKGIRKEDFRKGLFENCHLLLPNVEFQSNSVIGENGTIWFGSREGLIAIDETDFPTKTSPPIGLIEEIRLDGKHIDKNESKPVFENFERIEFFMNTPGIIKGNHVLYRYRLSDYDEDYQTIHLNQEPVIKYDSLPSGTYILKYKSFSNGQWQKEWVDFPFTVIKRTNSFLMVLILLALLIPIFFILYRKILMQKSLKKKENNSDVKVNLNEKEKSLIFKKLEDLLESEKIYRNESLLIQSVSEELDIPSYLLSKLIKEKYQQNFAEFINTYRINEVVESLKDSTKSHISILQLANDAGFNNKTSFNQTFKRIIGKTPSQYRKEHSDN